MKNFFICLFCAVLLLSGCSQHIWVTTENKDEIIPVINKTGAKHAGILTLSDGKMLRVRDVHIEGEEISFITGSRNETIDLSLPDIKVLKFKSSAQGAAEGLFIGLLMGGVLGAVIGFAGGDDPLGWFSMTAGEKAAATGIGLGIIGGFSGLLGGAIHGRIEQYYFKDPDIQTPSEIHVGIKINYPLYD